MLSPRLLALAVLATGCDTVLGLDRDGPGEPVVGSVIRRFEYNNASHIAVVELRPHTQEEIPREDLYVCIRVLQLQRVRDRALA